MAKLYKIPKFAMLANEKAIKIINKLHEDRDIQEATDILVGTEDDEQWQKTNLEITIEILQLALHYQEKSLWARS